MSRCSVSCWLRMRANCIGAMRLALNALVSHGMHLRINKAAVYADIA